MGGVGVHDRRGVVEGRHFDGIAVGAVAQQTFLFQPAPGMPLAFDREDGRQRQRGMRGEHDRPPNRAAELGESGALRRREPPEAEFVLDVHEVGIRRVQLRRLLLVVRRLLLADGDRHRLHAGVWQRRQGGHERGKYEPMPQRCPTVVTITTFTMLCRAAESASSPLRVCAVGCRTSSARPPRGVARVPSARRGRPRWPAPSGSASAERIRLR